MHLHSYQVSIAFWEYILQHPWEDYSNTNKKNFAHNVLLIIDKLCSSTQRGMLPTVQGIVQEFSEYLLQIGFS